MAKKSDSAPQADSQVQFEHGARPYFAIAAAFLLATLLLAVVCPAGDETRIALLAIGGAAVVACSVWSVYRDPSWLIVALIAEETLPYLNIIPLDPQDRWFLRYPLLLPLCLPSLWMMWRSKALWNSNLRYVLIFFLWGGVTVAYSLNPLISMGRLVQDFLVFVTLAVATQEVNDAADVQRLLGRFLFGCTILQIATAVAWFCFPANLTHTIDDQGLLRFTGVGTDANAVGSLMLATVGAGLAYWPATRGRGRAILAATMLSSVVFAVLADSRSETAAALFACAAFAVWKYRLKGALTSAAVLAAGIAAYSALGPNLQGYFNRDVTTLTGRTEAWQFELTKLRQSPVFGYGYEVEGAIFQDRLFTNWEQFWDQGVNTALHDSYLTVAIGMGLPALVFWLYAFIGPWITIFRAREDPWNLRPLAVFIILPALFLGIDESGLSEPRAIRGLLVFMTWTLAIRYQTVCASHRRAAEVPARSGWRHAFATLGVLSGALLILGTLWPRRALAEPTTPAPLHFKTLPLGAKLPGGAQCAGWIAPTPETQPENQIANHTRPSPTQLAFMRANGYHFAKLDGDYEYERVDGDYVGSTDMILRWAACKYGLDEDVMRGQAWQESFWKQATHGDLRRDLKLCNGGPINLWGFAGCNNCCWQSWSLMQTKVVPYEWMTWPAIRTSTAFAADYRAADQRSCMEGRYRSYFADRPPHDGHVYWVDVLAARAAPEDPERLDVVMRGCIGLHYSGSWYDAASREYIGDVWHWIARQPWRR